MLTVKTSKQKTERGEAMEHLLSKTIKRAIGSCKTLKDTPVFGESEIIFDKCISSNCLLLYDIEVGLHISFLLQSMQRS